MKVIVAEDYLRMCMLAADMVEQVIKDNPNACLGLATGSSPIGAYDELAARCAEGKIDFSGVSTVNLDEYVGLPLNHPQSYGYFMKRKLFDRINIDIKNTYVARGTGDIDANLDEFKSVLAKRRINLQILGIGVDGHIGFNEPGRELSDHAHIVCLNRSTIDANARFFENRDMVPKKAITMGVGDIMRADRLLLMIAGEGKEKAAKQLLMTERITTDNPATIIRLHKDAVVLTDRKTADNIGYRE